MPIFAGLFVGLFSSMAGFFAQWMTKKIALAAAAIAMFASLTVALFATASALVSGLLLVFPVNAPDGILVGFWLANAPAMIAALSAAVSFDTAQTLYHWNVENIKISSYIT